MERKVALGVRMSDLYTRLAVPIKKFLLRSLDPECGTEGGKRMKNPQPNNKGIIETGHGGDEESFRPLSCTHSEFCAKTRAVTTSKLIAQDEKIF